MKVYIGPPEHWYTTFDFVRWIPFISEETRDKLEDRVPKILPRTMNKLFRSEQKAKIRIDYYDTWSMDHTLAPIILPMLKQLKETNHGSPCVDDKDVPKELRSTSAPKKENEWDTDNNHHKRWEWVMDEMIWAFEQKVAPDEGQAQYYVPYKSVEEAEKDKIMVVSYENGVETKKEAFPNLDTEWRLKRGKFDKKLYKKWQERKNNGFMLFGKYFEALWD